MQQNSTVEKSTAGVLNPVGSITNVPGVKVGHFTYTKRPTGCSVILFEEGAAVGCDFDGSAPGSHQAELLQPTSCVEDIWGVVLSGGSSYGIHTALGVVRYLEERKIGMKVRGGYITDCGRRHHHGFGCGRGLECPAGRRGSLPGLPKGHERTD